MSRPHSPSRDLSGQTLGEFRILRRLGVGAMADVYLAEQMSLRRQVALKVLRPELASDTTYLERFRREARAAAKLVHANIVQIYEVGSEGDIHYIAMEYVPGLNLRQWLQKNGPADLRTALIIMRQVAAALAKAAEEGIVHRDIKPENILVTKNLEVKVADFGLARVRPAEEGLELTRVGMTMGTPLYMSPEQIQGKSLDIRSDIYSFGVTCYQLLTGEPPFKGDNAMMVGVMHLTKEPEPLETKRPDLPAALCRVVHQMLAKDPTQRFASPKALLAELRKIYAEHVGESWGEEAPDLETGEWSVALSSPAVKQLEEAMKAAPRPRSRRWVWAITIGVFWIAALGAGLLIGFRQIHEPPLLAGVSAPAQLTVPKYDTIFGQWLHASQLGTEEAWRAVIEYFPDKVYWTSRAKMRLAQIYLREDRLEEALQLFQELADNGDSEPELRAFGLAGMAGVYVLEKKYHEAASALNQLWPIRDHLRDPLMRRLVDYAITTTREKLGPMPAQEWDAWLDSLQSSSETPESRP